MNQLGASRTERLPYIIGILLATCAAFILVLPSAASASESSDIGVENTCGSWSTYDSTSEKTGWMWGATGQHQYREDVTYQRRYCTQETQYRALVERFERWRAYIGGEPGAWSRIESEWHYGMTP